MPKTSSVYVCSHCDAQYPKWVGRCSTCGKFGTVSTEAVTLSAAPRAAAPAQAANVVSLGAAGLPAVERTPAGFSEVDRVLGGGWPRGAVVLLTGEPGVGKSTLLLGLAEHQPSALYVSGEESAEQASQRLRRLELRGENLAFASETDISAVVAAAYKASAKLVVVDSLQTMLVSGVEAQVGSPSQARAVLSELVQYAKTSGTVVVIIGHVTKEGLAAGPKTIEHMVDIVLTLEGDGNQRLRFLRASKNRFGQTDEVGVFEMGEQGLVEVSNPSAIFLSERHAGPGSCVTAITEGTRSLLIEVQALVTRSRLAYPKRATTGYDLNRLQVLLAVLQERAGVRLAYSDVYVNLAGGLRSREPALDLAVCLAVASASFKKALPQGLVVFGEVGLGGEVRPVVAAERRLSEAARLGFTQAVVPAVPSSSRLPQKLNLAVVKTIAEAVEWIR